ARSAGDRGGGGLWGVPGGGAAAAGVDEGGAAGDAGGGGLCGDVAADGGETGLGVGCVPAGDGGFGGWRAGAGGEGGAVGDGAGGGAGVLRGAKGVITHCNTGALATAGRGTALAVILEAARKSKRMVVYVDETRPLLQGARLTAWECAQAGAKHRLITDSMAATVMQRGMAQAVIAGSDRIAANGDAASKIGPMPLAIVAHYYKVPFYIAAPLSTVDPNVATGDDIPIEERADEEITSVGGVPTAPKGTATFNPAFDVVPSKLIAGIVTEVGVLRAPYKRSIRAAMSKSKKT